MYKVRAVVKHESLDECYVYADEMFPTEQESREWIGSLDGFRFAQGVMVGLDVIENFEGYHLDTIEPELVEA
jgi:hypothetical protein